MALYCPDGGRSAMFLSVLIGYVLGSIPWALVLSRWLDVPDPRRAGSGNLGAANMLRVAGPGPALLVALLDIAKGTASVVVARTLDPSTAPAAAVAAVVGHVYPAWLGFRGGKGVATACGAFIVLAPAATVTAVAVFGVAVWRTSYASAGSLLATVSFPPMVYVTSGDRRGLAASAAVAVLIVVGHRSNLARLRAGTEARLGLGPRGAHDLVQQATSDRGRGSGHDRRKEH